MCSIRTLIKIAPGLVAFLIAGYVIFPQSRAFITAIAPYVLFLTCPIAMYFMMGNKNTPPHEKEKKPDQDDK